MLTKLSIACIGVFVLIGTLSVNVTAQNPTRQLKRMKGYTIVEVATVAKVMKDSVGNAYVKLDNGIIFNVEMLILDPTPYEDVIVFSKQLPPDLRQQYERKMPEAMLYYYKLMIDREIYDATPYVSR